MGNVARTITIERRRKFAGSAINFFIVLNLERSELERNVGMRALSAESQFLRESKQVFPLSNGEKITIKTMDASNRFFVVAFTSDGSLFSQSILVDDQDFDARYSVTLKLGFFKNQFIIEKVV